MSGDGPAADADADRGVDADADADRGVDADADGPSRLGIYLRGVCMGTADAVPGVSGGTIALLTGIYDRLIAAITSVTPGVARRALAALVGVVTRRGDGVAELRSVLRDVDAAFLVALGAGIATAILTVTRLLHVALETAPVATYGFFFGLIAASAVALRGQFRVDTAGRVGAAVAGFLVAFLASGHAEAALGATPLTTFLAGVVAVSAMILPGISGSLMLVLLGQYDRMSGALSAFVDAVFALASGGDVAAVVAAAVPVVVFCLGGVVGLLTVAHAVRRALAVYRRATMTFLVALVVGALRAPVVEAASETGGWTTGAVGGFVGLAVVGAAAVFALDYAAGGIDVE